MMRRLGRFWLTGVFAELLAVSATVLVSWVQTTTAATNKGNAAYASSTPGFILGWYHDHSGGSAALDEMAAHGFNTIMDYELSLLAENGNGQIVHDQLTGAAARGMGIQFHLSGDLIRSTAGGDWSRLDTLVNQYKNHPGLASWQMSDEPESSDFIPVPVFQAAAGHIRQIDTNHPASAVFTKEDLRYQAYVPSVDIASVDNYPIRSDVPNPCLRNYTKSAKRLVELESASGKRTLFVVQAFVADPEFAEPFVQPTAQQQRFLTYAPLTVGVGGLMYWTYYRNSPETRRTNVYPVTDFLAGLIPVLESTEAAPQVSSDADGSSLGDGLADVTYLFRQHRGSTYVVAANNLGVTRSVAFTLQGPWPAATIVAVLTENRTVPAQPSLPGNLVFSDTFGPYQVHLYQVIPAPSLVHVGYWRFEEASGPVAFDSSPSPSEDGILASTAERSSTVPTATVPQTRTTNTRSMRLNGVDGEAVDMDARSVLDVGSGDFTLEAWIHARTIPGGFAFIAGKRISGLFGDNGYELSGQSSGSGLTARATIRAGGPQVTATSAVLSLDHWYHVAVVRAAATTNLSMYVDGVLAQSVVDTLAGTDLSSGQHFSVGGAIEGDGSFHRPFDGFIDEVRLTKAALPPNQFLKADGPVISIRRAGNQLTLAWAASGFVLQTNDNVANPNGWTDMSNGEISPVNVQIQAGKRLYRVIGR